MANKYKDEKGHWTTKENDGGPCHHEGAGNSTSESFDDTWDEEFEDAFDADDEEYEREMKKAQEENARVSMAAEELKSQSMKAPRNEYVEKVPSTGAKANYLKSVENGNYDNRYKATVKELEKIPDEDIDNAIESVLNGKDYFERNKIRSEVIQNLVDKHLKNSPEPYPQLGYHMALNDMIENAVREHENPQTTANDIRQEQADRGAKAKQVQHFVNKAKQLKQEGKSNEIMNLLRGLDDDTANAVIDALMGK